MLEVTQTDTLASRT